ncbi:hypothetical protein [Thiomicrorhabdus sp. Kp2]|uniref:hypothetical protein n=1 Tax=Thiomicrorhabdus sp. Kp2 TaxID=1123518 RepID=UPI000408E368|nr:hypothetical protein [Thiomicrorhabdus sp. Kp2]
MIYIERNSTGDIDNIHFAPAPNLEEISLHDPKLKEFIETAPNSEEIIQAVLNRLDLDMVRIIEDVIDILIDKNIMLFTDLPDAVQNKILFKKNIRNLSSGNSIIEEEELINF